MFPLVAFDSISTVANQSGCLVVRRVSLRLSQNEKSPFDVNFLMRCGSTCLQCDAFVQLIRCAMYVTAAAVASAHVTKAMEPGAVAPTVCLDASRR
jgi:hypothetical protein